MTESTVVEVDDECNVTYSNGKKVSCQHRPHFTFAECDPGYGSHGDCPKWNYYHRKAGEHNAEEER
jgi:hypothetical protein